MIALEISLTPSALCAQRYSELRTENSRLSDPGPELPDPDRVVACTRFPNCQNRSPNCQIRAPNCQIQIGLLPVPGPRIARSRPGIARSGPGIVRSDGQYRPYLRRISVTPSRKGRITCSTLKSSATNWLKRAIASPFAVLSAGGK